MDPKLFFSDPDTTFQAISDPDPTWFPIKDEKANILKEKCSNSFNIKEEICEAFFYSKIDNKTWVPTQQISYNFSHWKLKLVGSGSEINNYGSGSCK